ncbi:MAG: type II toxin-antitoxin system prevent-host-death family antitoxin [Caulobacteraceae bacterium]
MIVNIHAAKTNLSKLIKRAQAGEEIVIARNGAPMVRLAPVYKSETLPNPEAGELPSWVGSLKGQIWISPDFDTVDAEIAREFEESEIFPPDDEPD